MSSPSSIGSSEFERHYERLGGQLPAVLHLSAWVTPISIISWVSSRWRTCQGREEPLCAAKVEGAEDGRPLVWYFSITTATRPPAEALSYIAIELGKDVGACIAGA